MAVIELVFSPTGGTKAVVDSVAAQTAHQLHTPEPQVVDLSDPAFSTCACAPDDTAFIAVPSYGGRVPSTATQRIARVQGNGARAVLVCVYGNRAYEDTLVELEDVSRAAGFEIVAAVAAIAEHSIVREVAAGRPDAADREELANFGTKIAEKIAGLQQGKSSDTLALPGNRPYKTAGASGMVPQATQACISCGTCARVCSVQAINLSDCRNVDAEA